MNKSGNTSSGQRSQYWVRLPGYIALNRGEQINALWIVVASVCVYLIAYRFYGLYIAKKCWRLTQRV